MRLRALRTAAATSALAAAAICSLGCAVGQSDLERWERTSEGPKRLSAVVLFDKYSPDLRVGAAMALIDMKPMKGQRVGIERLVKGALVCDAGWLEKKKEEPCSRVSLSAEARAKIIEGLVPRLVGELKKPPPPPAQGGAPVADPSYKFKDAAYMLLTYDKTPIIADPAQKQVLLDALRDWAMVDFTRKLNDQSQMFGMEQLLRLIGPSSVERLPTVMDRNSIRDLTKMADLIDKLASTNTREEASSRLVEVVRYIASDQWRLEKEAEVKAANDARQLAPTPKQFAQQMSGYQEDMMMKVFAAMKKVGGSAVVDYCISLAGENARPEKLRVGALQALDGRIDKKDTKNIARLVSFAQSKETPKTVVDSAFRLLKQLPREVVATNLYDLLGVDDWQIRRLAGATLLQISKAENIREFLEQLGKRAKKNFNPNEARTYAAYIADLKGGDPLRELQPFMNSDLIPARVTALSYYLVRGSKNDVASLKKDFGGDRDRLPKCDDKDPSDCSWECISVGPDKTQEKKTVEKFGEFVTFCILPQIADREPPKQENAKASASEAPKPAPEK